MTPAERLFSERALEKFPEDHDALTYELTTSQARFLYCLMCRLYQETRWLPDEQRDTAQRLDAFVVSKLS